MSVREDPETGAHTGQRVAGVVTGVFTTIVGLAAVAYLSMVHVVDWVTVGLLGYPVVAVAPFVVITGAILTIPILIPTALVVNSVLN